MNRVIDFERVEDDEKRIPYLVKLNMEDIKEIAKHYGISIKDGNLTMSILAIDDHFINRDLLEVKKRKEDIIKEGKGGNKEKVEKVGKGGQLELIFGDED